MVVERGARVTDSVIFDDVVIRSGAVVQTAIVDERSEMRRSAAVGEVPRLPAACATRTWCWSAGTALVEAHLGPGARLEPGTTA